MIVLDTNALIWWLANPEKLSRKARQAIDEAKKKSVIFISSISVLEILTLIKKDRLKLDMLPDSWLNKIEALPFVKFIPLDNRIAEESVNLDLWDKDPADRIIVATALNLGAKLVTSDKEILKYPQVQTMW